MIARMPELSLSDDVGEAEAEQAVDFLLVQDALGAALGDAGRELGPRRWTIAAHCAAMPPGAAPPAVGAAAARVAARRRARAPIRRRWRPGRSDP